MKALYIDSAEREIREVEYVTKKSDTDGLTLQEFIDGYIEIAYSWDNGDVLFVDEEGLFKPQLYFFVLEGRGGEPLAGNGILVGPEYENQDGSYATHPPTMTVAELQKLVTWKTRDQVDAWAKANASDPAMTITTLVEGEPVTEVLRTTGQVYADMPKPEPLGRLAEEHDWHMLKTIADRLGDGMVFKVDERRDMANAMHVLLDRMTAVRG